MHFATEAQHFSCDSVKIIVAKWMGQKKQTWLLLTMPCWKVKTDFCKLYNAGYLGP